MLDAAPSNVVAFPLTPEIEQRMAVASIGFYLDQSRSCLEEARKSINELRWRIEERERRLAARRLLASM